MLYISEITKIDDFLTEKQAKYPYFIQKIIYYFNLKFKKLNSKFIENNEIIYINSKSYKKLIKYLNYKKENIACLSTNLMENKEFTNFLILNKIKILDGRWLFNYISIKVIEYVLVNQNKNLSDEEIAIITNTTDDVILNTIEELAKCAKSIHIITDDPSKFSKIEKKLYAEYGVIINISNNYRKSLSKINIILNYNLSEEILNKYELPKYSIIINMKEKINIYSKNFEGLNISYYQIFMPKNYIKYMKFFQNFEQTTLYESFIYRKDTYKNIMQQIYEDNLRICTLVGINGNIKRYEYERLKSNRYEHKRKIYRRIENNIK